MPSLLLRAATAADLPRITEIYADAVTHGTSSYELEPPNLKEMTARFETIRGGGLPYIVAEHGLQSGGIALAGYAYASPFRPRPAYRFIVEDSVYVAPEAKGFGVGTALMRELIRQCTALGFRQIVAVIGDGRPDSASVILHERLGFTHSGRLEGSGYKHGRWLDTVFMQLALNGGKDAPPDPQSLPERLFRRRE